MLRREKDNQRIPIHPSYAAWIWKFLLTCYNNARELSRGFLSCRSPRAYTNVNKFEVCPKGKFASFNLVFHHFCIRIVMQLLYQEAVKPRHLCLWFPSFYSSFLPCELHITFYTLSLCCIISISAELLGSPHCLISNMKYCTVHPCKRPVFINQIFRRVSALV